jgi:acyl-CoA thioesterase FadM
MSVEYRVRFDEAGPDGAARPSMFVRYAQDCAWRHSEALGFGREWYDARGTAWLVRAIRLEQLAPAATGSALTVSTAISGFRRVIARRHTTVATADGQPIAVVDTDWVMTDRRGMPTRIPDDFPSLFLVVPPSFEPFRVGLPPSPEAATVLTTTVRRADLDPMGHANNGAYIDWADEAVASMAGVHPRPAALPRSFVVEYAAPARPGAAVTGSAWALPSGSIAFRLVDGDQELVRAVVEPID